MRVAVVSMVELMGLLMMKLLMGWGGLFGRPSFYAARVRVHCQFSIHTYSVCYCVCYCVVKKAYRRSNTATPSSFRNSFSTPTTIISSPVFFTVFGSALNTLVVSVTSCPTRNGFTFPPSPRGQHTSPPAHMRRVNGAAGLYETSVPSAPSSVSWNAGVK